MNEEMNEEIEIISEPATGTKKESFEIRS